MVSNRLAFAALAIACVGAAAGGGYLALRRNAAPPPAATSTVPSAVSAAADRSVQETEGIVGHASKAPASAAAPTATSTRGEEVATPAPVRRADAGVPVPTGPRVVKSRSSDRTGRDPLPTLERWWPSGDSANIPSSTPAAVPSNVPPVSAPAAQAASTSPDNTAAVVPRADEPPASEPARAPEPPEMAVEELAVPADSVIGLRTETIISSERALVEDSVEASVTRDVHVGNKIAIPAGARALGSVTEVERGGKFKERARLGIRFHTLVLTDGTRLPISTEAIYREGEAPGNQGAARISASAVGGAILGAILGGPKGAVIGATTGAGAGSAAVAAGDRNAATLPPGTAMTVRLLSPVTVTIEK